jgi:transposase-like protein
LVITNSFLPYFLLSRTRDFKDRSRFRQRFRNKIYSSPYILGIILTLHVNLGISSRKTAQILKCIFNVNLSHQSILNYSKATAFYLAPWLNSFKSNLSALLVGDETYIKIAAKWAYVFFIIDPVSKVITASYVSLRRSTYAASCAIFQALAASLKPLSTPTFIFDGNPIYKLAQLFFHTQNIFFGIKTVIGLKNKDKESKEFRPFKQMIERLNRTFKYHYRPTNGFSDQHSAASFVILFTSFYNFLRPHQALKYKTPIQLPDLDNITYMPSKWLKIIEIAQKHCLDNQYKLIKEYKQ